MKPRRTDSTDRNPAQYSKSICQCKFMKRHRAIEIFRRQIREKEQTLQLCKYSPVLWLTFDKAKSCSLHIICYFPPSSQEHQANNATPESHLSEKEITWRTRAEQTQLWVTALPPVCSEVSHCWSKVKFIEHLLYSCKEARSLLCRAFYTASGQVPGNRPLWSTPSANAASLSPHWHNLRRIYK